MTAHSLSVFVVMRLLSQIQMYFPPQKRPKWCLCGLMVTLTRKSSQFIVGSILNEWPLCRSVSTSSTGFLGVLSSSCCRNRSQSTLLKYLNHRKSALFNLCHSVSLLFKTAEEEMSQTGPGESGCGAAEAQESDRLPPPADNKPHKQAYAHVPWILII